MTPKTMIVLAVLPLALGGIVLAQSRTTGVPRHAAPPSPSGDLVVALCDGKTTAEIPGVKEGETPTPEQARAAVDALYNLWDRNPVTVRASYVTSNGAQDTPPRTKLPSY